jgi:8-oxo-dGTP pyrophosphatase MutT (NUDIX family)
MAQAPTDIVHAAGAVLVRDGLVAIVHRPRYDDWTLPKGKNQPGEDDHSAALREVREETGHTGSIERDLGTIEYMTEKRGVVLPKVVRYFVMRDDGGEFEPGGEVDALRWLDRAGARELLTYDRDREVLDRW